MNDERRHSGEVLIERFLGLQEHLKTEGSSGSYAEQVDTCDFIRTLLCSANIHKLSVAIFGVDALHQTTARRQLFAEVIYVSHVKKLMYTFNIGEPNVRFGNMLLEQFGSVNGELAAAMQYTAKSRFIASKIEKHAKTCKMLNLMGRLAPGKK